MDQWISPMMQWTYLRGLSCFTEPAPAPRWTMQEGSSFHEKKSVQQIPPIRGVLEEHVKSAVYKGGHIWGKTLLPDSVLPSPTDWEWVKTDMVKLPKCWPCNVNYCKHFYGNVFYIVMRAKLAWLHLVQPWTFLTIQDGGLGYLEFL